MAIATVLLMIFISSATFVGMQTLTMRLLAPTFGVRGLEYSDAAAISMRQVIMAVVILGVFHWMPIEFKAAIALLGALFFAAFQCGKFTGAEFQKAIGYVTGSAACAVLGIAVLGVMVWSGEQVVSRILEGIAQRHTG